MNLPAIESTEIKAEIDKLKEWSPASRLPPPVNLSQLFRAASRTIRALMQRDSFLRFSETPEFSRLLEEQHGSERFREKIKTHEQALISTQHDFMMMFALHRAKFVVWCEITYS